MADIIFFFCQSSCRYTVEERMKSRAGRCKRCLCSIHLWMWSKSRRGLCRNRTCYVYGPRAQKLKPAPLHNAVFMPLIPTMAVVIAALLHKLSAEIVLEIYFPPAHTSLCLIYSFLLQLLVSFPLPSPPTFPSFLSPSLPLRGTRKKQLSSSDEVIYEVIRCHEITRRSKGWDLGKEGEKGAQEKRAGCSDKRLWETD